MSVRVGQGFDIHAFSDDPARRLVLGGVLFEGARGLVGHSDADVIAHACADALLGAAGLGDIGQHFPDTDPQWKGADSIALLAEVARRVRAAGYEPGNVDCSVVCETPKLAPRREEMQRRLTAAVGAPVTIKGNRAEGLGALGRREGIAAWAVAVVETAVVLGTDVGVLEAAATLETATDATPHGVVEAAVVLTAEALGAEPAGTDPVGNDTDPVGDESVHTEGAS